MSLKGANQIALSQGIPSIEDYQKLFNDDLFLQMERSSGSFLREFALPLKKYRWVSDPLHQWSRQWEYPFTYSYIQEYISSNCGKGKLTILDAGSGVTFFPYYITSTFTPQVKVICCDHDTSFQPIFLQINAKLDAMIEFQLSDICQLPYKDNSFDVIYCVSVLEHTSNFQQVIQEFKRVLKLNGLLIVTFDISLEGDEDIPIDKATTLIGALESHLRCYPGFDSKKSLDILKENNPTEILTTPYVREDNKDLLPWKRSFVSIIVSLLTLKIPKRSFSNLACFCQALAKVV